MADIDLLIADLQSQLSFQEDTIAQLNEVVVRQDRIIQRLEEEVSVIKQQFRLFREEFNAAGSMAEIGVEKPPHY